MVKIGANLPKLSQNKTGYPFLDHPVVAIARTCTKFHTRAKFDVLHVVVP